MQLWAHFLVPHLFISPGRHGHSSTSEANLATPMLDGSNPDESNECDPLSLSHSLYPPQSLISPNNPTAPKQDFSTTTPNIECMPMQHWVSRNGPVQPYATSHHTPYHPGFSLQYPFPGYVLPPGYEVPYTTDSINPVPPNQEEFDRQGTYVDQLKTPVRLCYFGMFSMSLDSNTRTCFIEAKNVNCWLRNWFSFFLLVACSELVHERNLKGNFFQS